MKLLGRGALALNDQRALVLTLRMLVTANLKMRQHRQIDWGQSMSLKREENRMEDERPYPRPVFFKFLWFLCERTRIS